MAVINSFDAPLAGVTCEVIPTLDRMLGPIRPTHFDVGAGRPGMGKTAVAVSYARGAAKKGHGVLFFSLEMGAEELAERLLADECFDEHRIPYEAIRDRKLDMIQRRQVCRAQERIAASADPDNRQGRAQHRADPVDGPPLAPALRRARAKPRPRHRRLSPAGARRAAHGPHRGRVRGQPRLEGDRQGQSPRRLRAGAAEPCSRDPRRQAPQLSDLRESGQIEQDADAVLFLLRPEYYLRKEGEPIFGDPNFEDWQAKLEKCQGRIEFIIAKRRGGREGSAGASFLGRTRRCGDDIESDASVRDLQPVQGRENAQGMEGAGVVTAAQPFMKFYPQDWRADEKLRLCSLAARGLWIEMLALMHRSERYGQLLISGHVPTDAQLAVQVGAPPNEISALLAELGSAGVFSRAASGAIYSRRMTRDAKKAKIARANGKSGGNPNLRKQRENSVSVKGKDKDRVKPQIPDTRDQNKE
jgi:hypothetical protein